MSVDLEQSHGRTRVVLREVPALPAEDAAPTKDATTGRFLPGNRMHRRRQLKARAEGIATLNPARAPSWLKPHIDRGASYVVALLGMLEGKPALHPLAGDVADAHVVYRATLALALDAEDAKTRASLMSEARAWLREHRTALATLSALAGNLQLPDPDAGNPLARIRRLAGEEPTR